MAVTMAKKAPVANGKVPAKQSDIVWVNYTLSDEQKQEIKAQSFDVETALVRLTEEDMKVTISYDDYNECYSCFLIPKKQESINYGCILSGRGSTPIKSVKQACYLHWNIFEGNWSDGRLSRKEVIDD